MLYRLVLKNYRNLDIPRLELTSGVNILVGDNAQGKTNILEATHLLSHAKPIRGSKSEAINWSAEEAIIIGRTEKDTINLSFNKLGETKVLINNKIKTLADLFGKAASVLFHPAEIEVTTGPPYLRRGWMDKTITTTSRGYLTNLINYQRSLKNRNKLLREHGFTKDLISPWSRSVAKFGSKVWLERSKTIADFNKILEKISKKSTGKVLRLDYKNPLNQNTLEANAETFYLQALQETASLERRLGMTVFGPHRDDFRFILEEVSSNTSIMEKDAALYGSRGEQRQCVVLLKLAEAAFFRKVFGRPPTILLDDVFSELDETNRRLLLHSLVGGQAIITTSDLGLLDFGLLGRARTFLVKEGKVEPITKPNQ